LGRADWANQWFDDLERIIHPQINRDRKDRQKPVRVAILDTGINLGHPEFQRAAQLKKFKEARGFPNSLDPYSDRNGHGTHGASVLMRTSPHAVLYIARIADDNGNIFAEDNYAAVVEVYSVQYTAHNI
jgi:subtilisin family serine protease